MTDTIRAILYDYQLTYGAKILAFTMLDLPLTRDPSLAFLARKMHASESQVSKWRQELIRRNFPFRPPVVEATPPPLPSDAIQG